MRCHRCVEYTRHLLVDLIIECFSLIVSRYYICIIWNSPRDILNRCGWFFGQTDDYNKLTLDGRDLLIHFCCLLSTKAEFSSCCDHSIFFIEERKRDIIVFPAGTVLKGLKGFSFCEKNKTTYPRYSWAPISKMKGLTRDKLVREMTLNICT